MQLTGSAADENYTSSLQQCRAGGEGVVEGKERVRAGRNRGAVDVELYRRLRLRGGKERTLKQSCSSQMYSSF